MKRQPKRGHRRSNKSMQRPYRPEVRLMEDRALPGDTILGALLSHGLVGMGLGFAQQAKPAERLLAPSTSQAIIASHNPADAVVRASAAISPNFPLRQMPESWQSTDVPPTPSLNSTVRPSGAGGDLIALGGSLAGPLDGPPADGLNGFNDGSQTGLHNLGVTGAGNNESSAVNESSSSAPQRFGMEPSSSTFSGLGVASNTLNQDLHDSLLTQEGASVLGAGDANGDSSGRNDGSTGPGAGAGPDSFGIPCGVSMGPTGGAIATLEVPTENATGITTNFALQNGARYTLEAAGDVQVGSTSALRGDAQYQDFQHPRTMSSDGTTPVGIQISGATVVQSWGAYNSSHSYRLQVTGQGRPIQLHYNDAPGTYNLHHGHISVLVVPLSDPTGTDLCGINAPVCSTCSCSDSDQIVDDTSDTCTGDSYSQAFSEGGVRYSDGTINHVDKDFESLGYGKKWGQARGWTNADLYNPQNNNGGRTVISQDAYIRWSTALTGTFPTYVAAFVSGTNIYAFTFDPNQLAYVPVYFNQSKLALAGDGSAFALQDPKGYTFTFGGPNATPASKKGRLLHVSYPFGDSGQDMMHDAHAVNIERTDFGGSVSYISRAWRYDPNANPNYAYEALVYNYSNDANHYLTSVTLQRGPTLNGMSWTIVRQVQYTYYDGINNPNDGAAGDLQSATIWGFDDKDPSQTLRALDTTYYRYYPQDVVNPDNTGGFVNGLKYVVEPQSYARLKASHGDPITTSIPDSIVAQYADDAYVYWMKTDGKNGQLLHSVSSVTVQGTGCSSCGNGLGTFSYLYYANQNSPAPMTTNSNNWFIKTVETLPDGNTNTVYTNNGGEVMLTVYENVPHSNPRQRWATFYQYDADGRIMLKASPSAVITNDGTMDINFDMYNDVLDSTGSGYQYLQNDKGLIQLTKYVVPPSAPSWAMYYDETDIEQGQTNNETFTPIVVDQVSYIASPGSPQIYVRSTDTTYGNVGSDPRMTSYFYAWFVNGVTTTAQMQAMTINPPMVGAAQNGPAAYDVDKTFYDDFGRPIWHRNSINPADNLTPDGYINYTAYEASTGAVIKTIEDVDYSRLSSTEQTSFNTTGWAHVTGGLHLVTQMTVDVLGRSTVLTDPNTNTTYTVYIDSNHEVRTYAGWNSSTLLPTGPTRVSREDRAHDPSFVESYTMSTPPHTTGGVPDGTEMPKGLQSLSRTYTNDGGLVYQQNDYFSIPDSLDLTMPMPGSTGMVNSDGSISGNYWPTSYAYDDRGRRERVQSPTGTINRMIYDGLGRVVSTWVGTTDMNWSDTTQCTQALACNMVQTTANQFDGGSIGDSNLTRHLDYPTPPTALNPNPADQRESDYLYDWRDRQVASKQGQAMQGMMEDTTTHRPIFFTQYDNLDEVTQTRRYDGDTVMLSQFLDPTTGLPAAQYANRLRAQTGTKYDDQSRVYQTSQYYVDQTNGTVQSATLDSNNWYDHRGNLIKSTVPGGPVTKTTYDGADRTSVVYTTDGAYDPAPGQANNWAAAGNVLGNNVFTQVETTYDGDSNPILVTTRQRFHDNPITAQGVSGALMNPTTLPKARVSYVGGYFDASDRMTDQADFGTNMGNGPPTIGNSAPPRSDAVLVTSDGYRADAVQQVSITGSPPMGSTFSLTFTNIRTMSTQTLSNIPVTIDAATLQTQLQGLSNIGTGGVLVSGVAGGPWLVRFAGNNAGLYQQTMTGTGGTGYAVAIATTNMGGDDGRQHTMTDPRGLVTKTDVDSLGRTLRTIEDFQSFSLSNNSDRTTEYTYDGDGHTISLSADLANYTRETTLYNYNYTGSVVSSNDLLFSVTYPGQSQQEVYAYDALGEASTMTDRNGTLHTYVRDVLGRQTSDQATSLGTGVNNAVRRLDTAYDTGGRPYLFTSVDQPMGGNVLNQVEDLFNGFGQLIQEYQSHSGAVTGSTPSVQYAYSYDVTQGTFPNHSRLVTMTYPDGTKKIAYNYTGLDDAVSRPTSIQDVLGTQQVLEAYTYLGLSTVVQRSHPEERINLSYINTPNGSSTAGDQYNGLDMFGRVVDQYWATSGGSVKDEFTYGYDRDSNRLYRANYLNHSFDELYHASGANNGYDGFNQLTNFERGVLSASQMNGPLDTVANPTHSQSWNLDVLGNWSGFTSDTNTQNRSHNTQNQITSLSGGTGGQTPGYDNNGNTTQDDSGHGLAFDAWNRLVQVTNGMLVLDSYVYDALGRRIRPGTTMVSMTDQYFSSQWQVLEERQGTTTTAQYVWSHVYVDAMVERDSVGTRLYVQQDANYNVTAVANTGGSVQERYVYDPYGTVTFYQDGWVNPSTTTRQGWIYLHQGGRYDAAVGLYNFRHRDYSPTLGRWMEEDPLGYTDSANIYLADRSSPVRYSDPYGETISVSEKNCEITIHLVIQIYAKPAARPKIVWNKLASRITDAINREWNRERWTTKSGCSVRIAAGVTYDGRATKANPDAQNSIEIVDKPGDFRSYVTDYTTGMWNINAPDWVYAHEAGHLMNLEDQYIESTDANGKTTIKPKPGYEGSVMGQFGGKVRAWDVTQVLRTNDIHCPICCRNDERRIMKQENGKWVPATDPNEVVIGTAWPQGHNWRRG